MRGNTMATKRLYRSKNGEIFGVCKGIAQWKDFSVDAVRLVFILVAVFTAIFPCLVIYAILGFILPVNPYEEEEGKSSKKSKHEYYYNPESEDFASTGEASEQEERKKKENDWDSRFYSGK